MAITRIGDIIQPEVFTNYVVQKTMEQSNVLASGIAVHDTYFDGLASGPNTLVHMPYFEDLGGESETITDDGHLTPDKIGTNKDIARKQARAKSWGANGLSALLSDADPMGAIAQRAADFWARDRQRVLLSTLQGVFASTSMADKTHNIVSVGDGLFTANDFLDAVQLMGDAKDALAAITMHSAVETYLAKLQLIEYVQPAGQSVRIPFFMGKRVIVDDGMPFDTSTGEASTYIFGQGALAWGNGKHTNIIETETDRDTMASSGEDFLINRQIYILHPRGIKFTESAVADTFPTNSELATGANWERVYESKAVRMVNFKFKIE